ncbi:MAG: hypothetical protein RL095_423 [Verrucomicrobiota bacterium]|jgi:RNA polymerase sigma factor (sigma-70 family)
MSQETRHSLIAGLTGSRNEMAWEAFLNYYGGFIGALLRRHGLSHADIDDLRQEILLRCWRAMNEGGFEPGKGRFRSWLARICHNAFVDHCRSNGRRARREESVGSLADDDQAVEPVWIEEEWQAHLLSLAWQEAECHFSPQVIDVVKRLVNGETPEAAAVHCQLAQNTVIVYRKRVGEAMARYVRQLDSYL